MRKAAARSQMEYQDDFEDDDDYVSGKSQARRSFLFGTRPVKRLCVITAVLLGGTIVLNALYLQEKRHSAPLFQTSLVQQPAPAQSHSPAAQAVLSTPAASSPAAFAPLPPPAPRPPDQDQATQSIRQAQISPPDLIAREIGKLSPGVKNDAPKLTRPKVAKAAPASGKEVKSAGTKAAERQNIIVKSAETTVKPVRQNDAIASLLKNGAPPAPSPNASVLSAQRSLQKLGYVVRADGVNNDATRQALQSFARDNALPGKGELNAQLVQTLNKMSAN